MSDAPESELIPYDKGLSIPAELIDGLAAGLEDPDVLAARYDIDEEQWAKLKVWKPFLNAVEARRAEFERDGLTFRLKRAMQADVLSDRAFTLLMSNQASIGQVLEGVKIFAKLGDVEPKPSVQAQQGTGFSITINMSSDKPKEIDITPAKELLDA